MDSLQGKRLASFIFYIRVNQLEVRLDKDIGMDEASLHSPERMATIRSMLSKTFPGCKATWAFSHKALLDERENYQKIRALAKEYLDVLGDEITYLPGAFFSNVYNSSEEINEMMRQGVSLIEKVFNYKPKSLIAGYLASHNQKYLAEELDIHVCQGQIWSQFAVDNGDGDGGVAYPYYPSTEHFIKPAQNEKDKIDCICFDGWTVDFVSAIKSGFDDKHNSRMGFGPIETLHNLGPQDGLQEQMETVAVHFEKGLEQNGYGFVTAIWELSLFGGKKPMVNAEWFEELLLTIKRKYPDTVLTTIAEIGEAWRKENPDNTRWNYLFKQKGSGIFCSDAEKTVRWYMNRTFRLAILENSVTNEKLVIDYTDYTQKAAEPGTGERNWSILGFINQKNSRLKDKPIPFWNLPLEIKNRIFHRYPELAKEFNDND